ncbi:BRO family protein [Salinicola sp. CR57]|uniref:BRO-N domain-containing protein n=1 Tax=Salinicola sp. CR57 TaxID=1949086 RepID=UPI0013003358|nr:BRO family protein [Salinicola sp. CR57]
MTATAQVLPFQFDTQEARTLLTDDQPWFFAMDVCGSPALSGTNKALLDLDVDENREHEDYSCSGRKPVLINKSGLYSLILCSRKAEAKRFKKWVIAEVLPANREYGRHDIVTATIGTDGLHILHELTGKKIKVLPRTTQRQARAKLWSLVHTRFNVPRVEMIPAADLGDACNFIAACALDGRWLPSPANDAALDEADRVNLYALCSNMLRLQEIYREYRLYDVLGALKSPRRAGAVWAFDRWCLDCTAHAAVVAGRTVTVWEAGKRETRLLARSQFKTHSSGMRFSGLFKLSANSAELHV